MSTEDILKMAEILSRSNVPMSIESHSTEAFNTNCGNTTEEVKKLELKLKIGVRNLL